MFQKLIGLHGAAGAGKDTIAEHLVSNHGFVRLAFGDILRDEVAQAFDLPAYMLTTRQHKESPSCLLSLSRCRDEQFVDYVLLMAAVGDDARSAPLLDAHGCYYPRSPRWIMQRWGDWRRSEYPYYWIYQMLDLLNDRVGGRVVISDVRSVPGARPDLEAHIVRKLGGELWHVTRPGLGAPAQHLTEQPLPAELMARHLDNSGSIAELLAQAETAMGYTGVAA
ncbi:hypothetical protein [Chitiniphilus eburneus]|uniref:hypothetical protein n=1 Tax=Chitiniphilus eburneus TaxID=2571148 RepID=UPI0035D03B88